MERSILIKNLTEKQTRVIREYCNTIGCKDCPLKEYDENDKEDCESSQLQRRILDLEYEDIKHS